jgi:hypothetical protein
MGQPKTWEQPRRSILDRWRDGDVTLATLECEHVEPVTGLDLSTAVRCQQCNPVMRPRPLALPGLPGGASGW